MVPGVLPLVMETKALAEEARATHRGPVYVMEPPIDIEGDNTANDGTGFRAKHGVAPSESLVVKVSRLSIDLKLYALVNAVEAANQLADSWPARLIIAGDGQAAPQLRARAATVNRRQNCEAAGKRVRTSESVPWCSSQY